MEDLEKEIEAIKARNKRVEMDKKWETSGTRKICKKGHLPKTAFN